MNNMLGEEDLNPEGFHLWAEDQRLSTMMAPTVMRGRDGTLTALRVTPLSMGRYLLYRLAVPVPFYHCFGMVLSNLLCLSVGACLVIPCEHFDPLQVLQAVEAQKCTAIHGVPTMFVAELEHPAFGQFDLSTLRTGIMAGAPCPPELMRRVMQEMSRIYHDEFREEAGLSASYGVLYGFAVNRG